MRMKECQALNTRSLIQCHNDPWGSCTTGSISQLRKLRQRVVKHLCQPRAGSG